MVSDENHLFCCLKPLDERANGRVRASAPVRASGLMGYGLDCDCDCDCCRHRNRCDAAAAVRGSQPVSAVGCAVDFVLHCAGTSFSRRCSPFRLVHLAVCCACVAPLLPVPALPSVSTAVPSDHFLSQSQAIPLPKAPFAPLQAEGSRGVPCVRCARPGRGWSGCRYGLRVTTCHHSHCRCCRHQGGCGYRG